MLTDSQIARLVIVILLVILLAFVAAAELWEKARTVHGGGIRSRKGAARARKHFDKTTYTPAEQALIDDVRSDPGEMYERVDEIPGRLPYRGFSEKATGNYHQGQLKLLMGEVEFLTKHGDKGNVVVYVAGAPGHHTPYLAKLFPNHQFFLYDPAPFGIDETDRIHLFQTFFTDELAEEWGPAGKLRAEFAPGDSGVLLINDIRSATESMTGAEFEERVKSDNDAQARWYRIVRPAAAMIKHRWPFSAKTPQTYPEGERLTQVFPPPLSAETRLVLGGPDAPDKKYDPVEYEERLFYHNMIVRPHARYKVDEEIAKAVPGFCGCYDCRRMADIWRTFLVSKKDRAGADCVAARINEGLRILGLKRLH